MKKYIFGSVFALSMLASPLLASAAGLTSSQINAVIQLLQSFGGDPSVISNVETALGGYASRALPPSCVRLTQQMTIGSTDATSGGEVTELQTFLQQNGYFTFTGAKGYYGLMTADAVGRYQVAHNIVSSTDSNDAGITGPQTRSAIESETCGVATIPQQLPSPSNPQNPTAPAQTVPTVTVGSCGSATGGSYNAAPSGASLCGAGTSSAATPVTITSPVGGSYTVGQTIHIAWTPSTTPVQSIAFIPVNGGSAYYIWSQKVNGDPVITSGSYDYTVRSGSIPSGSYLIGMSTVPGSDTINTQNSYAPITITNTPTLFFGDTAGDVNSVTVQSGGAVTLKWDSTSATSCSASAVPSDSSWTGSKSLSGTQTISNITTSRTYYLTCNSLVGISLRGVASYFTVNVTPAVSLSGLTNSQIQAVLSLLSTFNANNTTVANVTTVLNGGTVSSTAPSGLTSSQIQSIISLLTSFGANSTTITNVQNILSVTAPPPVVDVWTPSTVTAGQSFTLTWSSTNATSCSLGATNGYNDNGSWGKLNLATSGSLSISPYPSSSSPYNAQYNVTCVGSGGSLTVTAVVTVQPTPTTAAPVITTVLFGADVTYGTGRYIYTIDGTNLANVVKVKETHLVDGETDYTSFVSHSDSKIVFATNYIVGQSYADSYQSQVSVVNSDGTESNIMPIQINFATSAPAPTITSTSAKAAGNFEMDAGDTASITGSNFPSNATVYLGGLQATVISNTSTLLWINVPNTLAAGNTYPLYVTGSNGTSNTVQVNILSNLAAPTISSINPTSVTQSGTVTVYGTNFDSGSYVEIAGMSVTPNVINSTTLTFVVPTQVSAGQTYQFQIAEEASALISNYSPVLTVTAQ